MESFADDKYYLAKSEYIDNRLLALHSFHKNIKFIIINNKKTKKDWNYSVEEKPMYWFVYELLFFFA